MDEAVIAVGLGIGAFPDEDRVSGERLLVGRLQGLPWSQKREAAVEIVPPVDVNVIVGPGEDARHGNQKDQKEP
jgi:hypothetical protein